MSEGLEDLFAGYDFGGARNTVPAWMLETLRLAGAREADGAALSRVPSEHRAVMFASLLDLRSEGGAKRFAVLEGFARYFAGRGWPRQVGCELLTNWARATVQGFAISNSVRAVYVAEIAIRNADLRPYLEIKSPTAKAWMRANGLG